MNDEAKMIRPITLGFNIDHVATLRQARGTRFPDPVYAAQLAEYAGADSITFHLREDRRHIQERDALLLKQVVAFFTVKPASSKILVMIMVSVFAAFVLGDDRQMKLFGLGMAVAVFIDATIVRMVLVPATMELLGNRNWWIPKWLDRVLPKIDVEGHQRDFETPAV